MATNKNTGTQLSGNNFVIVFVLVSLLVVGITGLVGRLLITSILRDSNVVKAKSAAVNQLSTDVSNAPKLVDAYLVLGKQGTVLSDALPVTPDLPSLIVALESMGNSAGVTVKSVTPTVNPDSVASGTTSTSTSATSTSPATTSVSAGTPVSGTPGADMPPTPQTYQFAMDFTGTYTSLQKLLGEVELSARPMRVVGIQITGGGPSLSGVVNIETYYQAAAQWPFGTETIK